MTFAPQHQDPPGHQSDMTPIPDCGEQSYVGHDRLSGKVALITGGDSGIGRATAIAFAREGADVAIHHLDEEEDARTTAALVRQAGSKALVLNGDLAEPETARDIVNKSIEEFGRLDILVSNAAAQMTYPSVEEVSDSEWDHTFDVNVGALFRLVKAALPYLRPGSSIIGTSSINSDAPSPGLAPYAATKAAIANYCASLAQMLGPRGIRVNSVAPGPIWTPLIPTTMPEDHVEHFGENTPLGRAGQPAEVAPVYVLLASDEGSYISGARIAVTGGRPVL
jgi:hypothetical protein